MNILDHVIQCPDDACCGTLIERIVGVPQCNECSKCYKLTPLKPGQVVYIKRMPQRKDKP